MLRSKTSSNLRNVASVQVVCPSCEAMSFTRIEDAPAGHSRGSPAGESRTEAARATGAVEAEDHGAWRCPHCDASPRNHGPRPVEGRPVRRCWICGADEFYIQKDFNRELGLLIVLLSGGLIFLIMLITQNHRLGIGLLIGVAVIDWIIYRLIDNVTVCYLCHSLYRGLPRHAEHAAFYLGNEEKYKKLRKKWLEESVARRVPEASAPSSGSRRGAE